MPVATKTKFTSSEVKPWDALGMSYQKYNYQRKRGLLPNQGDNQNGDAGILPPEQQISQDTLLRNNVLLDDFLERCEANGLIGQQGLWVTQPMCAAVYHALRQAGH
jgi:hypothetical protein